MTRELAFAALVATAALGCGGGKVNGPGGGDPTLGLCAAVTGATPEARLDGAAEALRRGCYRDAFGAAVAARTEGGGEAIERRAERIALEARLGATAGGYDRREASAETETLGADWLFPSDFPGDMDLLNSISKARRDDVVDDRVVAMWETLRLYVRLEYPQSCMSDTNPMMMDMARGEIRETFGSTLMPRVSLLDKGHAYAVVSRAESVLCNLEEAAKLAYESSRELRDADAALACSVELDGVEYRYFPGGFASEMPGVSSAPADSQSLALVQESLAAGEGKKYARAVRESLGSVCGGKPTGDDAVRVAYLDAVVTAYMDGDAAAAITRARAAQQAARAAGRADLVDAARVVETLALIERGDLAAARALAGTVNASLIARGAHGAQVRFVRHVGLVGSALALRGRSNDAVTVAEIISELPGALPPTAEIEAAGRLGMVLFQTGRLENAEVAFAAGLERIERIAARGGVVATLATMAYGGLDTNLQTTRELLYGSGSVIDRAIDKDSPLGELTHAVWRGDEAGAMAAFNRGMSSNEEDAVSVAIGAAFLGYCDALDIVIPTLQAMQEMLADFDPRSLESLGQQVGMQTLMDLMSMIAQFPQMAISVAQCGAQTGRAEYLDQAQSMIDLQHKFYGKADENIRQMIAAARLEVEGRFGDAALAYVKLARGSLGSVQLDPASMVSLSQIANQMYERAAIAALRQSPPSTSFALSVLEETRARGLRAARSAAGGTIENVRLAKLSAAERELNELQGRRRWLGSSNAGLDDKLADLDAKIKAASEKRQALQEQIQRDDPAAYQTAALAPPLAPEQLQKRLGSDEVLVYYLVTLDRAFAIVVERDVLDVVPLDRLGASTSLIAAVRRLRTGLARHVGSGDNRGLVRVRSEDASALRDDLAVSLSEVYEGLVAPLLDHVRAGKRVIIVPDENTLGIPFAALSDGEEAWIARNPLRIVPGAYLLPEKQQHAAPEGDALVVGGADFGGAEQRAVDESIESAAEISWQQLPGTLDEAKTVAGLYDVAPVTGTGATEAAVTDRMKSARLIHLATHGFAFPQRPSKSALVLAAPRGGGGGDGLLEAYEIERLRIRADLVILSACETAIGQARGGEGVLSLDRAFLVAGAGAVVSSQWLVDDAATAALMKSFHQRLAKGDPADVALAKAMNQVRKSKSWRDLYFWAAFHVVGGGAR